MLVDGRVFRTSKLDAETRVAIPKATVAIGCNRVTLRLRDSAAESQLCSSDIRLVGKNDFYEAFFDTKLGSFTTRGQTTKLIG